MSRRPGYRGNQPLSRDAESPPQPAGDHGTCFACDRPLGVAGGFGGTGMCGPCATGDAETIEEFGEAW